MNDVSYTLQIAHPPGQPKVECRAASADGLDVGNQTTRQTKSARLLVAVHTKATERGAQKPA